MGEVIAIVSGKGGVGKTTLTANLGLALAELKKSVLLIDADIAMSNLSLLIGLDNPPITLHDVLLGSSAAQDAIYEGPKGISLIPSGLSISNYQRVDVERLVSIVKSLQNGYDYILIDAPAGIDKNVISVISASSEVLLVTEPTAPSVADVFKAKIVAERLNQKVMGVVVNKVSGVKGEITEKEIMKMLELPSLGRIPYAEDIRESFLLKKITPLLIHNSGSKSADSFRYVARKITGIEIVVNDNKTKKKGFFAFLARIFSKNKKQKTKIK